MGFDFVASGPMVRSSHKAADYLKHLEERGLWPKEIIEQICHQANIISDDMMISSPSPGFTFVQKYDWNYLEALAFQEACVDYIYHHPTISIIIGTKSSSMFNRW